MRKYIKRKYFVRVAFVTSFISVVTIILSLVGLYLSDKIINKSIARVDFAMASQQHVTSTISQLSLPQQISINIETPSGQQDFTIDLVAIQAKIDAEQTTKNAFVASSVFDILGSLDEMPLSITYSDAALSEQLSIIASQVYIPPVYPDITVIGQQTQVTTGELGYELDIRAVKKTIIDQLEQRIDTTIETSLIQIGTVLSESEQLEVQNTADSFAGKDLVLTFEEFTKTLNREELTRIATGISGQKDLPMDLLIDEVAAEIGREPQNPIFNEQDGKVVEFEPAVKGITLKSDNFTTQVNNALTMLAGTESDTLTIDIPTKETEPDIKTSDVNTYGIKELIGRGSSQFVGSIPNRVHNVALASSKISGSLVAPGETFSFNKTVGDISVYTGFKQSYVIQGNQTVLGDGGGVCQVSTTLFRAALNAGLPIAERRAHSYRVGYYEQSSPIGLDATIYSPTVDLKITNDTPAYILIQAIVDTKAMTLEFEIYGTDDGRIATVTDPVITSQSPAPEPLYIDDPTKPAGYLEQIDYAAAGARVEYDYRVERQGEILIDKKFYSNYRPWQAKYIRGTGPAQ